LKEAKTGKQRLAIYGGQFQRAMQEYRTAKNSEKKFEALGKVKEASDSINGEIEAMAKKQEERNKNVWTTAAPQKAVTAGSTEAYSIQNKLYNSFQRNVERNTKDMVGLNKRMIAELQTLNSQQQSEYTLDVKV
jgi:type III secretory pathway component EscV